MIQSDRTKKRKIINELSIVNNIIETSKITSDELPWAEKLHISHQNSYTNKIPLEISTDFSVKSIICNDLDVLNVESENLDNLTVNQIPHTSQDESINIKDFIADWTIQFNVPHNAVNSLLKGLKQHKCFNNFPVDSRTLMATPKQSSIQLRSVDPSGIYFHFGLTAGIIKYTPDNMLNVKIVIGIDGLPLFKSSGAQFWPIMGYVMVTPPFKKNVFPVGIYFGYEKPKDSNTFLLDFVTEAIDLLNNGLVVNQVKRKISISTYCCDAPAKAFILKIKNHTGFFSCTRCIIEGEYLNNRVCFPYSQIKSAERTHQGYINTVDEHFHNSSQSISILHQLPEFESVKHFSLDYMHLVCLGVMKKLMFLWVQRGPLHVRLNSRKVKELSSSLTSMNLGITSDFTRKSRPIQEIHRWKATEYRLFLLYTGQIVLKKIVSNNCYTNFMALNISMLILLSPNRCDLLPYAKYLLDYFVMTFEQLYGKHFVSHNVHGLLHLCDDYEQYGPLDNCSSFLFENYLKKLKSFVKKPDKPLEQVINRYSEINTASKIEALDLTNHDNKPLFKHPHTKGPLIDNINGQQYYTLIFDQFKINVKYNKDCFILTNNGEVVKCMNIVVQESEILVIGKKYELLTPFSIEPINSTILEIFVLENLSNLNYWKLSDIKKKMMVLEYDGTLISMPIIHT